MRIDAAAIRKCLKSFDFKKLFREHLGWDYRPILKVLEERGGRGKVAEVLERVGEIMKPILKDVDYDPLASGPDTPRWRNAAQWARNSMVKEGLLNCASPRGIWEITAAGSQVLKDQS